MTARAVDQGGGEQRAELDVPELLEQLAQKVSCGICVEPIGPFDMFVVWPVGDVVAHMACYVQGRALPRIEATS